MALATLTAGRGRLLLKPIPPEATSPGGIAIVNSMSSPPDIVKGTVVDVGADYYEGESLVSVAAVEQEVVYYSRYCPAVLNVEGEEYHVIHDRDIIAYA